MTTTIYERNECWRGVAKEKKEKERKEPPGWKEASIVCGEPRTGTRRERRETLSRLRPVSVALLSATHFLARADAKRDRYLLSRKPMQIGDPTFFSWREQTICEWRLGEIVSALSKLIVQSIWFRPWNGLFNNEVSEPDNIDNSMDSDTFLVFSNLRLKN